MEDDDVWAVVERERVERVDVVWGCVWVWIVCVVCVWWVGEW